MVEACEPTAFITQSFRKKIIFYGPSANFVCTPKRLGIVVQAKGMCLILRYPEIPDTPEEIYRDLLSKHPQHRKTLWRAMPSPMRNCTAITRDTISKNLNRGTGLSLGGGKAGKIAQPAMAIIVQLIQAVLPVGESDFPGPDLVVLDECPLQMAVSFQTRKLLVKIHDKFKPRRRLPLIDSPR